MTAVNIASAKLVATVDLWTRELHLLVSFSPVALADFDIYDACNLATSFMVDLCTESIQMNHDKNEMSHNLSAYETIAKSIIYHPRIGGICSNHGNNAIIASINKRNEYQNRCIQKLAMIPPLHELKSAFEQKYYIVEQPEYSSSFVYGSLHELNEYNYRYLQLQKNLETNIDEVSIQEESNISAVWRPASSPFHFYQNHFEHNQLHKHAPIFFHTNTSSILSGEGMHQTFHNEIQIFLDKKNQEKSKNLETINNGFVLFLMPISEHYFIDMDDPSPHEKNFGCQIYASPASHMPYECQIQMIINDEQRMDIEQPSFVSPQHIIALNISFYSNHRINNEKAHYLKFPLRLSFDLTLHLRYLEPIATYMNITVPSPFVYCGEFQDASNHNIYRFQSHDNMIKTKQIISVCTGSSDHFWIVIIFTGLAGLIGAMLTIKFISQLSMNH